MIIAFLKAMFKSLKARRHWLKLKKQYDIDSGLYVLLMADDDRELNEIALRRIDDLVSYRNAKGVLILTTHDWILDNIKANENVVGTIKITPQIAYDYYHYYYYYAFSERFIIVSLTKPFGNDACKAVGVSGVTKEDLVCLSVFIIRNWPGVEV